MARGAASNSAKLTADDVVRIRALRRADVRYAVIASQYGVTTETIARVCRRETWAHVPAAKPEGDASR